MKGAIHTGNLWLSLFISNNVVLEIEGKKLG